MDSRSLYAADYDLIREAEACLEEHFHPERHDVASALRTESGEVYTAINVNSRIGNASVHGEPVNLANALKDGHTRFDCSAAVYYPDNDPENEPAVTSACGVCRELLYDYDIELDIIVMDDGDVRKASITELLPGR
ncbi:cytidine deaminase [Haloarchaeobius sp. TZWSO28]|uniref:cytidine deaminase n=1 Tax=Haloarchaeobius sp. TZWSO28 TaxID=3446119 RepID=UPI003EB80FD6